MDDYIIAPFEEKDREAWDAYVRANPTGNYYHLSGWKTVVERTYSQPTYFWVCRDGSGRVAGLLPTVHLKHIFFGNSLVSMPYLDVGGILAETPGAFAALLTTAMQLAATRKIPRVELRHRKLAEASNEASSRISFEAPKVQMEIALPENSELFLQSLKHKMRQKIRKSIKNNLSFELNGAKKLDEFYEIFAINMRDLGSPVHSKAFFEAIFEVFQDYCQLGVVYLDKKALAAGIFFCFGDTVSLPWSSALRSHGDLNPNTRLFWEFMKYACDAGYKFFNLGRSPVNSGTYHYKLLWGAQPSPLRWQYLSLEPRLAASNNDEKEKFSLLINLWKKMPVSFTKIMGPGIRKHISL